MADWANDEFLDQPRTGLRMQKRITYYEKNGRLYQETITRRYFGDDDYQDGVETVAIN